MFTRHVAVTYCLQNFVSSLCIFFQSHTLELDTADIPVSNANVRGKSRARPAGRIREQVQVRVNLSSEEIEAMVEQEAERVARELAEEPSSSLLALHDARREMDDIAMRAQVRVDNLQ